MNKLVLFLCPVFLNSIITHKYIRFHKRKRHISPKQTPIVLHGIKNGQMKNFEKFLARLDKEKPILSVKTRKDWIVDKFILRKKEPGDTVKDLTSQFKKKFSKNKGGIIEINYGNINTARNGDIFYFVLLEYNIGILRSQNFRYDQSKGRLSTDDNPSKEISMWGWIIFILFLVLMGLGCLFFFIIIKNVDQK